MAFAGRSVAGLLGPAVRGAVALVLAGLATPAAAAEEKQYRKVVLVDGREIYAEVLSTEPKGLMMQVPQGKTLISFELLLDMTPITEPVYQEQKPWVVYFDAPPEIRDEVQDLLGAIENVHPQPIDVEDNGISAAMANRAAACNRDVLCMASEVKSTPDWMWVLGIQGVASGLRFEAKVNKSGPDKPNDATAEDTSRDELWRALHEVLELQDYGPAPRPEPGVARPESPRKPFDAKRVFGLSLVPVPGLPSLAQGDSGGFALAMGVVVPSTALWIGVVGASGESVPETGLLAAGGYYVVTVFANQVAGLRSMSKRNRIAITAAPTIGGGAQVVMVGAGR